MTRRGVFFDLYGTLLGYGDMEAAWAGWLQALHESLSVHGLTDSTDELARHCDGFFGKEEPARVEGLSVFESRIQALVVDLGLSIVPADLGVVATKVIDAWHKQIWLDPEAPSVLRELRKEYLLALISNYDHPSHVHKLLDEHGLREYFDLVVISGEVGIKKPDPGIMKAALDAMALEPESCLYVGDTEDDERCALAAGVRSITIDRRDEGEARPRLEFRATGIEPSRLKPEWQPKARIRKLDELRALLKVGANNERRLEFRKNPN